MKIKKQINYIIIFLLVQMIAMNNVVFALSPQINIKGAALQKIFESNKKPQTSQLMEHDSGRGYRVFDLPEGYRDITVVLIHRGAGFGNRGAVNNLLVSLQHQFRGKNISLRLAYSLGRPGEESDQELRMQQELIAQRNSKAEAEGLPKIELETYYTFTMDGTPVISGLRKTDVAIYFGYDSAEMLDVAQDEADFLRREQMDAKLAFHIPIYATGYRLRDVDYARILRGGTIHRVIPTANFLKGTGRIVINPELVAKSIKIDGLNKQDVLQERRKLLDKLGVTEIPDGAEETTWAFAYTHNYGKLEEFLRNCGKSKQKITLFLAPGYLINRTVKYYYKDNIRQLLEYFKAIPDNVNIVFLEENLERKDAYNQIMLLSGVLTEYGLKGGFPNLITGDQSTSEVLSARRLFVHDGMNAQDGDELWQGLFAGPLQRFTVQYNDLEDIDNNWPNLFTANPQGMPGEFSVFKAMEMQMEFIAAIDSILERRNIVDHIGKTIVAEASRQAADENLEAMLDTAVVLREQLNGSVFEKVSADIFQDVYVCVNPRTNQFVTLYVPTNIAQQWETSNGEKGKRFGGQYSGMVELHNLTGIVGGEQQKLTLAFAHPENGLEQNNDLSIPGKKDPMLALTDETFGSGEIANYVQRVRNLIMGESIEIVNIHSEQEFNDYLGIAPEEHSAILYSEHPETTLRVMCKNFNEDKPLANIRKEHTFAARIQANGREYIWFAQFSIGDDKQIRYNEAYLMKVLEETEHKYLEVGHGYYDVPKNPVPGHCCIDLMYGIDNRFRFQEAHIKHARALFELRLKALDKLYKPAAFVIPSGQIISDIALYFYGRFGFLPLDYGARADVTSKYLIPYRIKSPGKMIGEGMEVFGKYLIIGAFGDFALVLRPQGIKGSKRHFDMPEMLKNRGIPISMQQPPARRHLELIEQAI
ncbi:MAG: hypothetical protein ABII88_10555 [Candidatus Omnitrophota bacterium]